LTVRDMFSRFILGIRLLPHRHEPVQRYFQAPLRLMENWNHSR
jgi:hypothetical protein